MRGGRVPEQVRACQPFSVLLQKVAPHEPPVNADVVGQVCAAGLDKFLGDNAGPFQQKSCQKTCGNGFSDIGVNAADKYGTHKFLP